jgi:hypothetical protein
MILISLQISQNAGISLRLPNATALLAYFYTGAFTLARTPDVLTKLVNRWPASRIDDPMPWAYAKKPPDPISMWSGWLARL